MAKAKSQAVRRERTGHAADAERWTRLLIIGGVVAVIALAIGIIGFGWYWTQVRPLGKTVLRVGDTKISLGHLEGRVRLSLEENTFFQQSESLLRALPEITLGELEQEAKLLEAAHELNNTTVTEEELDAEILERGGSGEGAVLVEELNRLVKESRLSKDEYLQMVRAKLLEEKVRNYFTFLAPKQEAQVRARLIYLTDEKKAEDTLARLKAGEEFAAVARDASEDSASAEKGGELDWLPRGARADIPEEAENFLFKDAALGQHSEVISGPGGAYIVQLLERNQNRELTEQQRPLVVERLLREWLKSLDAKLTIERDFSEDDLVQVFEDVFQ